MAEAFDDDDDGYDPGDPATWGPAKSGAGTGGGGFGGFPLSGRGFGAPGVSDGASGGYSPGIGFDNRTALEPGHGLPGTGGEGGGGGLGGWPTGPVYIGGGMPDRGNSGGGWGGVAPITNNPQFPTTGRAPITNNTSDGVPNPNVYRGGTPLIAAGVAGGLAGPGASPSGSSGGAGGSATGASPGSNAYTPGVGVPKVGMEALPSGKFDLLSAVKRNPRSIFFEPEG